ncbi:hypothetical protein [Cellulomonas iranensis]|uniref:hypothetical protein n=1 Tax=Cellulomonas iranensis TaxID=76862 RepID=UPI0013D514A7|nr:hypothetical protein [Cellulomonas iranensis]
MSAADLHALLGDAYDETTPAQRDAVTAAVNAIAARWPEADLQDTRDEALGGALRVILDGERDQDVVAQWHRAVAAERAAHARMTGAIIAAAALDPGESEVARAARLNITRVTLRKALGR